MRTRQLKTAFIRCITDAVDKFVQLQQMVKRKPDYRVRVTSSYAVEYPCRHYEELMRLCRHAFAAIKVASTLVGLPQYQNVMDHRWLETVQHLQNWRAQHTGFIKRMTLAGHAAQLKQENLIWPRVHVRSGRKHLDNDAQIARTSMRRVVSSSPGRVQISPQAPRVIMS